MQHYDFARKFHALYDKAAGLYARGQRGAETYFTPDDQAWLAGNGLTAQYLYDYAEDQKDGGEPGFEQALGIELIRRDYHLNVQGGEPPGARLDEAKLPAKTETAKGIAWLPRIIPKARAKLRGELPASLMYCCGGDRRFFKENNIVPAEFLNLVWRSGADDAVIIDWVVRRKSAGQ